MFCKRICVFFIVILLNGFLFADHEWGDYPLSELSMKSCPDDSTAAAVVLFDKGEMVIDDYFQMILTRHVRVKILKEAGMEKADVKIGFWHDDEIKSLKAQSVTPDGKIVKLSHQDVFEEQINENWKQKVFAVPGVEVGSVFEFEYVQKSKHITCLEPWSFQSDIPTNLSRYEVHIPDGLLYKVFQSNYLKRNITPYVNENSAPGYSLYIWEQMYVPPVVQEPYMASYQDYLFKLFFQLMEFRGSRHQIKFIETWSDLAREVNDYYGKFWKLSRKSRKAVQPLLNKPDHLGDLFTFVRDSISTEDKTGIYMKRNVNETLMERLGKPSEKNLLLLSLLRQAGHIAYPLLLSTRENGTVIETWPQIQQFNRMVVCLMDGETPVILDASAGYSTMTRLPREDLVKSGLCVQNDIGFFLPVRPEKISNRNIFLVNGEIDTVGNLKVQLDITLGEYDGLELIQQGSNTITSWVESRLPGCKVDQIEILNAIDINAPIHFKATCTIPHYAQVVGDMIYSPVPCLNRMEKNPFQNKTRQFPVDFVCPVQTEEHIRLVFPPEYRVDETPEPVRKEVSGVAYQRDHFVQSHVFTYQRRFAVNQWQVPAARYSALKALYSYMVTDDNLQIVLMKNESENK